MRYVGNVSGAQDFYLDKMPHPITYYLPELEDPERSFIAQLTGAMPAPQVQATCNCLSTIPERPPDPLTNCDYRLGRFPRTASLLVGPSRCGSSVSLYLGTAVTWCHH